MTSGRLLSDYYNIITERYKIDSRQDTNTDYETAAFQNSLRRVISCLVNEQLVTSVLIQIPGNHEKSSFWIVLQNEQHTGFKIWIPIAHKITARNINFDIGNGTVRFLDPSDIGHMVLFSETREQSMHCDLVSDIRQIFGMINMDSAGSYAIPEVINEINNSIKHQISAYKQCHPFVPLFRLPIEYEQAITVGHATHPMNKSRVPMHQMGINTETYDFKKIKIYFFKVSKSSMNVYGNYEKIIKIVATKLNISYDQDSEIIIPVHELQKDVVKNYFKTLEMQETLSASAVTECCVRSVNIENISEFTFKLSLGVVISSTMRTITHWSVYHSVLIGKVIRKILGGKKNLIFLEELGSVIVKNHDINISKHFACIIRENIDAKLADAETAIVCAYLTEKCDDDEYNISKLFHLKSQKDKDNFSELYAKLLIDSFFYFVYEFGFSFEAHQQNVLLRVKKNGDQGFELTGFIVRDFGGIMVHQETLHSKIGMKISVLDSNAHIVADNLEDVYTVCYHTLFHCHLQQIFRSLGTHQNGKGWQFVRSHLKTKKEFLANESCVNFFRAPLARYKCFIKMKLNHLERSYCYTDVPNIINFNEM